MTVAYDGKRTSAEELAKVIQGLGYKTDVVANPNPNPKRATAAAKRTKVVVPKDAPRFFVAAMRRAREKKRPVVIDFWSTGCVPCVLLKKLTMEHKDVAKVLDAMEVIFVDLDKHPSLGKAYSVKTVPDVFFIDTDGFLVDRLRKFEAVVPFLLRLAKLTGKPAQKPAKKPDQKPVKKAKQKLQLK